MEENGLIEFSIADVIAWILAPFGALFRTFLSIGLGFVGIEIV